MATASDVAHALLHTGETLAKRLDDAPTGVEPGYNALLGATVRPNGKLAYIATSAGAVPGAAPLIQYYVAGATSASGATTRINFSTMIYDPQSLVTTGALWRFTAPSTGWYLVDAFAGVNESSIGNTYNENDFLVLGPRKNAGATMNPWAIDFYEFTATTTIKDTYFYLNGTRYYYLTAGDTFYLTLENQTSFTRTMQEAMITIAAAGVASVGGSAGMSVLQGAEHLTGASSTLTIADAATDQVDFNVTDTNVSSQLSGTSVFTAAAAMDVVVAGTYAFTGSITLEPGFPGILAHVYKNGSLIAGAGSFFIEAAYPSGLSFNGSSFGTTVTLAPGDTITLKIENISGQTLTYATTGATLWTITQVG